MAGSESIKKVQEGFEKAVVEEAKSQNMKTELITNVSHDLKTPLTMIKAYAEMIRDINKDEKSNFLIIIDNFRFDQWKILQTHIEQYFRVEQENVYYSIIPTTTQYARNALLSGMMPSEIKKTYPNLWIDEDQEGLKNQSEYIFLQKHLKNNGFDIKTSYHKILNATYTWSICKAHIFKFKPFFYNKFHGLSSI